MKFDVTKVEGLLYDSVFSVLDHDNKFHFYGIFKSVKPDELTFHITGSAVGSKSHGIYTFPAGSHFTLYKMKKDDDNKQWVFTPNGVYWTDVMEKDNNEKKEMKADVWRDCVVKENEWVINDKIKNGDTIYRIKTDTIDIKGKMTIMNTGHSCISVKFDNSCERSEELIVEITPDMRVFKIDSQNDPGILVQHQKCKFNPDLCVGKLYWIVNDDLQFQYIMHVRSITDNSVDFNIINTPKEIDNTSSIKIIGKSFDITELLEYKFKEI